MREILQMLLERDDDITARAVARLRWRGRVGRKSGIQIAATIAEKDLRIADLESQVALLTASHLPMLGAAGELGGFSCFVSVTR
jgi:hypothetical protein